MTRATGEVERTPSVLKIIESGSRVKILSLDLISLRLERGFRFQERSNSLYVARSTGRSQIHRRAHSISGKETNLRLTAARCEERPERGPRRQRPRERDRDQERERERQRERDRERGTAERGEEMERERPRESEKRVKESGSQSVHS
jgi:hypothetical protein